jgi:hypothetical protein
MKHLKIIGVIGVLIAAIMSAAGASAATLTAPSGTVYTGSISASSEGHLELHNNWYGLTCNSSLEGQVEYHGSETPVGIGISALSFDCTSDVDIKMVKAGFNIDSLTGGNGTLTLRSLTIENTFTGLGNTCTYVATSNVDAGTLTTFSFFGISTLDINVQLIREAGSFICGEYLQITGSYKVNTPEKLSVD